MNAVFEQLTHLLDDREVRYDSNEDTQSIRADIRGDVGNFRVVAHVDEEAELFEVFGYSPLRVPEGCRPSIALAVARANYGLRVGKFELDLNDGEIRFQVSQILVHDTVAEEVMDRMIGATVAMLDLYLPAFLSVIYGNEDPKDAIACVEQPSAPDEPVQENEEE